MLWVATHDYAAARCLLLNLHFPGLVLGAQAIEKFLKAYLLFNDPRRNVRKLSHSLPKLLDEVDAIFPALLLHKYAEVVEKFSGHYQTRYPDNPGASSSRTTADLADLDEFIIFLNENLPCPKNVKYRTGLYSAITFSLGPDSVATPCELWVKMNNNALSPLLSRIVCDQLDVLKELYP